MQYRAGNVTVQTGSNVVIGDGTQWLANAPIGAPFAIEDDLVAYTVARVVSDTEIRLSAPYEGPGGINLFYSITNSFTPKRGYPIIHPGDIDGLLILNRSVQMIDNDMPSGGAEGARALNDLADVDITAAVTGYALVKQIDGTWRGQAIASGGAATAENAGAPVANSAAILKAIPNIISLRRIVGDGITVTENADTISLRPTSVGEVATMRNLGTSGSYGVFKQKFNTEFQMFAFREGSGIRLAQEGDEIVISSTVTGGGTGTVVSTTASNVGTGFVKVVKNKVNEDIKFRSIGFDTQWFDVSLDTDQNTYTVRGRAPAFNQLAGINVSGAVPGTYLSYGSDGIWRPVNLPPSGIKSLAEDIQPKLGGPLDTAGQKILGVSRTKTIVLERPKVMTYPVELANPRDERIVSVVCFTGAGECDISVSVDFSGEDSQLERDISATTTSAKLSVIPSVAVLVNRGSTVDLRVRAVSVDAAMLAVEINYISV